MTVDLKDLFPEIQSLDEKSVTALLKSLKQSFNEHGFDYLRFRQSVKTLTDMSMDSDTSYKSSFATASTLGLTKTGLVQSANKYIYALEQEREKFATALLAQKAKKVDGRKAEVKELKQKIKNHKIKIKELEKEIVTFQLSIDNVDEDVSQAKAMIEGTKTKFMAVYDILEKAIKTDIQSIKKIL